MRVITKDHEKLLGVMDSFIILTVVMVSYVYTYVKTHQLVHFKFVKYSPVKERVERREREREPKQKVLRYCSSIRMVENKNK